MAERMLKFVVVERQQPQKRAAEARTVDFDEIYAEYADAKAKEQAARCSQCGIPFCQTHCPLHNNIPDWLRMTAEGRLQEAYELSAATSTMPEVCGRICPQDRLCEGSCVIEQSGHGTVTIGSIEKYLTDKAWAEGWVKPLKPRRERAQSVGIVGAGPAGLSAAEALREKGYLVTVYDRHDRAGGLLIYGIPGFKLEKEVVERRTRRLTEGGVNFRLNTEVGRDVSMAELRARHDALLIATGVYKAREIIVPGTGSAGVTAALPYLIASNRTGLGDAVAAFDSGELNAKDKDVVVVGGGDTAMDCVRTAVRQGARSVTCLYRRDKANMPGSFREVSNAEEEGVVFEWLAAPRAMQGDAAGVSGVRALRMRLGPPDASGRQSPEEVPGADFDRPAQMVIKALGFDPEDLPTLWRAPDLAVSRWGTVRADLRTMMTSLEGVFAAGDIVRGASLVVWAIRDGLDAAAAIDRYLEAKAQPLMAAE
jgi:glutamate synthase (NADPH/NADH) small chain